MPRLLCLLGLAVLVALPGHSQINHQNSMLRPGRLTGEALNVWKASYPAFRADSLRTEQLFEASAKAEAEARWYQADSLWLLAHNLYVSLRYFVDDVNRQQRLQSTKVLQTAALQHKLDADNAQRALSNKQMEERQRQSRIREDSAKSELERAQIEEHRLGLQKVERAQQKALQEAAMQQQKESDRLLLLWLAISVGSVFLFLLIVLSLRRRRINKHVAERNAVLEAERDKANAAEKMKSFFIQNMSHEIRTPLNAIVGFSDLLANPAMELSDEERDQMSKLIHQNSDQLTTLVSDILDISNLQTGTIRLKRDNHPVNELCRYAINTVEHQVPQNVRLYFTTELDDTFCIDTDAHRVRQVLINFLTNANKYTTQGEIHLHVARTVSHDAVAMDAAAVTFSVTDTGSGISGDMAERVFERFEKLDSMKQGTGLGLNICRLIARYLGATVSLDTSYGGPDRGDGGQHGCRFLFVHPVSAQTPEAEDEHSDHTARGLKAGLLALMLSCSLGLSAQDNIYKIDNHIYSEFVRLNSLRTQPQRFFVVGDSLLKVVQDQKQRKAECMIMTSLINMSAQEKMLEQDALYTNQLKELGERYHLTQYTYWAWTHDVQTDIVAGNYKQAQQKAAQMMERAQQTDDPYGKVQSQRIMGQLYSARNLPFRAAECYEEAAHLCQRLTPDQDQAILWTRVAECYLTFQNKKKEFYDAIEKALNSVKTDGTRLDIYYAICRRAFYDKDTEKFLETWALYDPLAQKLSRQKTETYLHNLAIHHIIVGRFDDAKALIAKSPTKESRLRLRRFLAEQQRDYANLLIYNKELFRYSDSVRYRYQIAELAEMESDWGNYLLQDSVEQERLRALQLQEQEEHLKMEALYLAADSMQRKHLTDSLELLAAQSQLEMAEAEAEARRLSDESEAQHQRNKRIVLYIVLTGLVLGLALGCLVLLLNIRSSLRLRRINRKLTIARTEALKADEKKTNFIRSVSHEVRTPLNAIVGSCELLCTASDVLSDDEKLELRRSIGSNTKMLTSLINDILALSRIESEKTKVVMATVNVRSLLDDLHQMAQQRETTDVKSVLLVDDSVTDETTLTTDPNLVKQMVDQLLSNAFKFTKKGEVRIVYAPGRLAIEDTGQGIPESEADTIFERFYKTNSFTQGTGLGLALVKAIAQRLNLRVQLDKTYAGPGARFVIEE